ncbi:sulfite exporter TauE/SafE family protein [uncultured Desulfovibrio sp.]|uniref:sulfite exporter TauE/SafE family protein n=1 Tax=uncultured Desulfovibrio sp. TaxID=167968 RepID=UPI002607ECCD|nr:sulfite exporter TauE/SafE family protein [uncultured Desulfovibrio sp.]
MSIFLSMLLLGGVIGCLGVGGSGLSVIILSLGFHVPVHTALGVSMAVMAFTMASGTFSHFRGGRVLPALGIRIGLFGALGAFTGAHLAVHIRGEHLLLVTASAQFLSGILIYYRVFRMRPPSTGSGAGISYRPAILWLLCMLLGLFNGMVASLCGVGSAAFLQFCLMAIFRISIYETIGTTMLVIMPIALLGGAGFLSTGHLDAGIFLATLAGQMIGAFLGAKLTPRIPLPCLKVCMVACPILGGLVILLR